MTSDDDPTLSESHADHRHVPDDDGCIYDGDGGVHFCTLLLMVIMFPSHSSPNTTHAGPRNDVGDECADDAVMRLLSLTSSTTKLKWGVDVSLRKSAN